MAHFEVADGRLRLCLGTGEHIAALSGDVSVPLADVTGVELVDPAFRHVSGGRVGTGFPGLLLAGRFYDRTETVAVCHGSRPGVLIRLRGDNPGLLVATVDDPDAVAREICAAAGLPAS